MLKHLALKALHGVGDPSLGEWHEWTGVAYHVRRRLSEVEMPMVGPVLDIRGTPEAMERLKAIADELSPRARMMACEECNLIRFPF